MPIKRIFYVDAPADPSFDEALAGRADVAVERVAGSDMPAAVAPVLEAAHAYQISAARDELPRPWHADAALLANAPSLLVVSSHGAGYDTVDVAACTAAGVLVVNQAGANREAVAEHALGMLLALTKRIVETDRHLRRERGINRNAYMGREALGKTIGIVGFGHIGTRLAELCRSLFRMRVLACDPYLTREEVLARGADEKVELDELLRRADYVSVNCPLSDETRGLVGARELALMQSHAYFITTARGFIHDEAALLEALRQKKIAGAGLDVWDKEPPPPDHPLLQLDNVIASPHTAGVTREARRNIGRVAAEQILETLEGKEPPRLINREALPLWRRRFEKVLGKAGSLSR